MRGGAEVVAEMMHVTAIWNADVRENGNEFLAGFISEAARVNFWWLPPLQTNLAIKSSESFAMLAGRLTADVVSALLAAAELAEGGGAVGGGILACATGVGCPLGGGEAIVLGGVLVVQGVGTGVMAAEGGATVLAAMSNGGGGGSSWRPLGVEDLPDSYVSPKGGPRKVVVQYGPYAGRVGWLDEDGNIWVATKPGESHGGPHWDVQINGGRGGHYNVYP